MRAHWRPSLIAHTISDCPRRASPAAKTPFNRGGVGGDGLHVPARVLLDAELIEQLLLGVQEAHREQHQLGGQLALGALHRRERRRGLGSGDVQSGHAAVRVTAEARGASPRSPAPPPPPRAPPPSRS